MRRAFSLCVSVVVAALAVFSAASAADPGQAHLAVVRITIPSGDGRQCCGSGTVIWTEPGRTLILSCAHLWCSDGDPNRGVDQAALRRPILIDMQRLVIEKPSPIKAKVMLVGIRPNVDLALIEINQGPVPYDVPVCTGDVLPKIALSVGFDGAKWPPHQSQVHIIGNDRDKIYTREQPWHGRSGGALLNEENGHLIGVVHGYTLQSPNGQFIPGRDKGMYVSYEQVCRFVQDIFSRPTRPITGVEAEPQFPQRIQRFIQPQFNHGQPGCGPGG